VGWTAAGPTNTAVEITSFFEYEQTFGAVRQRSEISDAVRQFFSNGGSQAHVVRVATPSGAAPEDSATLIGSRDQRTGLYALEAVDIFNILAIPRTTLMNPAEAARVFAAAVPYCEERRAFFIIDPDPARTASEIAAWADQITRSSNAAVYFPQIVVGDPVENKPEAIPSSGAVAGVLARIDSERGVWNAPAGLEATLKEVQGLSSPVPDAVAERLGQAGVNCLRELAADSGPVVWGARTRSTDEYKYISVRRLALFIEQSLDRGLAWTVFQPNGEPLWAEVRTQVQAFVLRLFQERALAGMTSQQAYFVRCDRTTMTQQEIDEGIVNVVVGFAPLKPSEFVIISIRRLAAS
jgi:phage tail sheath protein FI